MKQDPQSKTSTGCNYNTDITGSNNMRVVNVNREQCSHYCGRKTSYRGNGLNCSILGNPFLQVELGRALCIQRFRDYLNEQRLANSDVWKTLVALPHDAVLGCWCKPHACHCDVIISAWTFAQDARIAIREADLAVAEQGCPHNPHHACLQCPPYGDGVDRSWFLDGIDVGTPQHDDLGWSEFHQSHRTSVIGEAV